MPSAARNTNLDAYAHDYVRSFEKIIRFERTPAAQNHPVMPVRATKRNLDCPEARGELESLVPTQGFEPLKIGPWGFGLPSLVVWGDRYR